MITVYATEIHTTLSANGEMCTDLELTGLEDTFVLLADLVQHIISTHGKSDAFKARCLGIVTNSFGEG